MLGRRLSHCELLAALPSADVNVVNVLGLPPAAAWPELSVDCSALKLFAPEVGPADSPSAPCRSVGPSPCAELWLRIRADPWGSLSLWGLLCSLDMRCPHVCVVTLCPVFWHQSPFINMGLGPLHEACALCPWVRGASWVPAALSHPQNLCRGEESWPYKTQSELGGERPILEVAVVSQRQGTPGLSSEGRCCGLAVGTCGRWVVGDDTVRPGRQHCVTETLVFCSELRQKG